MLRYLMSYPKTIFRFIRPVHAIPKRINGNISKKLHAIWKILFILGSYEFLACLECISRNGLSFGHSDWHPSSVPYFAGFCEHAWTFVQINNFSGCRRQGANYHWPLDWPALYPLQLILAYCFEDFPPYPCLLETKGQLIKEDLCLSSF